MSEYHADQEDTVLAYVRLKSGARPFNLYGDGSDLARQTAKAVKSAKGKPLYTNNVIDLAAERSKRAKRLK